MIARGSSAKPTVERVRLTPVGATPQSIVLQAHQAGFILYTLLHWQYINTSLMCQTFA